MRSPRQYYTKVEYAEGANPSSLVSQRIYDAAEGTRMQPATVRSYGVTRTPAASCAPNLLQSLGTLRRYGADETVCSQDEMADYWYQLAGGAARKCTQMLDGRRQIVDFLLPGDLFGFHAGARHDCSVECVVPNTTVVRYSRPRMESLMESDPQLARRVREVTFESIDRMQSRTILLGCGRALERVGRFLLDMADRRIETDGTVALPMSRYDIADYLAIAVETVSRSLTTLRSRQAIAFLDTRHFRIVNRKALETDCCR
jgi:CRP/FNR family transcriptional regulator, nitrogen fixation regulation protein